MAQSYTLLNAAPVRAIASSTNATPIVVTATAHGFVTGDRVVIRDHATNTAANGVGAGTGTVGGASKWILCEDFDTVVFSIDTDGGGDAAGTIKFVASDGKGVGLDTTPDLGLAQSVTNRYDFIEVVDLEDGALIDGDTGFVVASADNHVSYEANVNAKRWVSCVFTAGTAGEFTVTATVFDAAK
jgi:hypothetical protein